MSDLVHRVLGDYRLELLLGAGALGQTFRARHLPTGHAAAVKVLHARFASAPGFPGRFEHEAGRAAALRHPGIVAVEQAGSHDGYFYVATAYCADGSLRALVERRDELLPLARGVHLVRDAAAAVGAAHEQGVLHRDVKPENVLLVRDGGALVARVTDFGLTRLAETGATLDGDVAIGSPAYLSPEHCRGVALDARSDVYSLGVVLYEVATGHPPFQVRTLGDAVAKHLTTAPPPPSTVAPAIPARLDAAVLRCLAKQPGERFQTMPDLVRALDEVLAELHEQHRVAQVVWRGDAPRVVFAAEPAVDTRAADARREAAAHAATAPASPMLPPVPPPSVPPPVAPSASRDGGGRRFRVRMPDDAGAASNAPTGAPHPSDAPAGPAANGSPLGRIPLGATPGGSRRRIVVHVPEEEGRRAGAKIPPAGAAAPPEAKRISVVLDRPVLELTPGVPAFVQATVANGGTTVDHFELSVDGAPGAWLSGPRPDVQLNPGDRATVMLTVLVPAEPASRAGSYPVAVRARSRDNPAESGAADARWTVLPFARPSLTLAPTKVRAWRRARFVVTLGNQGNAPMRYALTGADEEQRVRYEFAARDVELEPGSEQVVALAAVAPLRWIGTNEMRALTVHAYPVLVARGPGDPTPAAPGPAAGPPVHPQVANAQLVHRALIPVWLPPVALAALAAFVLYLRWHQDQLQLQVAVTPAHVPLAVGATARLTAAVTNKAGEPAADQAVEWASQDTTVATVSDSGVVRGRREGLTTVVARRARQQAAAEVQVTPATISTLVMSPRALALAAPAAGQLRAVPRAADGTVVDAGVTWMSSDPSVATVGGNGRVVAKGAGSATITATAGSKVATAEVAVTGPPVAKGDTGKGGAKSGAGAEDCVAYDPAPLRVAEQKGAGWAVTDGSTTLLVLDTESDARRALALARRHTAHCFLGRASTRPNKSDYIIEDWRGATGVPTVIDAEDCVRFNKPALRTADLGPLGWVLADDRVRLLAADTREDAKRAWDMAQAHAALCYIGRGNRRPNQRDYVVQYWK